MALISYDSIAGSFLGRAMGLRSRNNKYISQPDFYVMPFTMNKREQWVTINENEHNIYLTTPELKLVIDRLALMFSNGHWRHLDRDGNIIENSPFVERLEDPNVFQSRNEFLFQWFVQRSIYANTFMYQLVGSSLQEVPTALWNLSPSRISVVRTGNIWSATEIEELVEKYIFNMVRENKTDEVFTPEEIIQFSMPNSEDPLLGVSPLNAIRMPLSNIRAAYGYLNTISTKKGAIGVWSSDAKDQLGSVQLTPEEEQKVTQQLTKTYGIGDHQSSVAVSSKALKWNAASYPTKDLLLPEQIDANKRAIIDLYGANDNMFSREKGSTFTNVEQGERLAYQDTIIPIAIDLANGLAKRWGLLDKGEKLELTYDHIPVLKEHKAKQVKIIKDIVTLPIPDEGKVQILTDELGMSSTVAEAIMEPEIEGEEGGGVAGAGTGGGGENVQTQVLNGAQVTSMVTIAQAVAAEELSPEAGRAILQVSFGLTAEQAAQIIP